jgi:hypothetical protein
MQTKQFVAALQKIVSELKVETLTSFLAPFLQEGENKTLPPETKNRFAALVFGARSGYERALADPFAAPVLKSLNFAQALDVPRLNRMLTLFTNASNSQDIWANNQSYRPFMSFITELAQISKLADSVKHFLGEPRNDAEDSEDGTLEFYLIDYDGHGVELQRIGRFVEAVTALHENFIRMLGLKTDRLRVRYLDTGSDVVIAIQAAKLAIEGMKVFLSEFWSKVRFRSHEQFSKNLDAIGQSLDVMKKVQESVDAKIIDQETGENIKKRILLEADRLIGIGAAVTPIDAIEVVNERQLLIEQRDLKLLGPGEPSADEGPTSDVEPL